jgi:ubiquinone/menaquinone biosynthesis C-methylase UbiE
MNLRIAFSRFLIQLGALIQSLPVLVMRSDDLVEFSRQSYAKLHNLEGWTEDALVDSGLGADELDLLNAVPETTGNLLLLGVGGGREAVPLAKMGFRVTGVDYVAAMVERAKENADHRGTYLEGLVQEISNLDVPSNAYNVVWLSRSMYSCVPTRARRVEMVKRITRSLTPEGYFLLQFHWDPRYHLTRKGRLVRRLIAACFLGNTAFEEGDILWGNIEFVHIFTSEDQVRSELEEGGLSVIRVQTEPNSFRGGAICKKS